MKTLLLTLVLTTTALCAADYYFRPSDKPCDLKNDLPKTFAEIKTFLANPKPTRAEAERLANDTAYLRGCMDKRIGAPEFIRTEALKSKAAKAARCQVIDEIAALIQPYNQWLLELQFGSKNSTNETLIYKVCSLLPYTQPDEAFRQTLEKKLRENEKYTWNAFALLYQHNLITLSSKRFFIDYVNNQKNPEDKKQCALGAAYYGYGEAAIPYCEELLSQPFNTNGLINENGYPHETKLSWDYRTACETLNHIGTNAASLLPLLKKRLAEIEAAQGVDAAKPLLLGHIKGSILFVDGTYPPQTSIRSPHCMWCK